MGIAGFFGFGKKEKMHFKIPDEVWALRNRIEIENRENYPNVARYQEIVNISRVAFKRLDMLIAQAEYSEEAFKIKEDIRKKMDQLTEKINRNRTEARKEAGQEESRDYVESNLAYLERKGRRNQAKTLFTECLEEIQAIMAFCKEERLKHGVTIESATQGLTKAMSKLDNDFFKQHGDDKEIKEIRENLLKKIQGLVDFFEENRDDLKEKGLEAKANASREEIVRAAIKISNKMQG